MAPFTRPSVVCLACLVSVPAAASGPGLTLEVETGPAYIARNDGRYGDGGTLFDAGELGQQRNLVLASRFSAELAFGERHRLILLYAPFSVTTTVTLPRDIVFRGTRFAEGTVVDSGYLFDGYRASYLYRLLTGPRISLGLGASLQIRNAAVSFASHGGGPYEVEPDIGLVFALKARLRVATDAGLFAMAEMDGISSFGIASVSGALYDLGVSFGAKVAPGTEVFVRGRLLGGGADVPRRAIYNWGDFFIVGLGLRVDVGALFGSAGATRSRTPSATRY